MKERYGGDLHPIFLEGMIAIRGLLEGRGRQLETQNSYREAALEIAEAMHNLDVHPDALRVAAAKLQRFRDKRPVVADEWLKATYKWVDSICENLLTEKEH